MNHPEIITDPFHLAGLFLRFEKQLQRGIKESYNTYTMEGLLKECIIGNYTFWLTGNSFLITSVTQIEDKRYLNIPFLGGSLDGWEEIWDYFKALAKKLECVGIFGGGRKGWQKLIKAKPTNQIYYEL